ncbi:M6 family metalloprotease domain-containing protein [candidate division WOR-3 bacterium]|nr:M6 family metalloprotease domain-containing protein [candidate division WOR-3 bacterium]
MFRQIAVIVLLYPLMASSMPPRQPGTDAPHSCIVGRSLDNPKDLRDYTIETCAILIQFSDNPALAAQHTTARYDSMFYSTGVYYGQYRAGSLNDFFLENSYGTTNVTGGVAGDQWHMSVYNYSHYYDGYYMLSTGYQLASDAVGLVDAAVDFSQYDMNNDGRIDGVFVIHAGPGGEDTGDTNHCWSHAIPWFNYSTNDGVIIDGATNVPEFNLVTPALDTTLCCIGVMCHELGHIVGLPDLYDGSRNTWGIGYWGLMGYGAWGAGGNTPWSPSHADAWCKTEVNWVTPVSITSNTYGLRILDSETHAVAYRVWRNGIVNDTFFLLENRQNKGFDTPLPGSGLLIWHIDPRYSAYHNFVDLEEADGRDDLDNGWGYRPDPHYYHHELGDPGDPYPGDSNNTVFDSLSYPASTDGWGHPTHVSVRNITIIGDTVVCDLIIDPLAITDHQQTTISPLLAVAPNPFSKLINISFCIEQSAERSVLEGRESSSFRRDIELGIYDATGRLVRDYSYAMRYAPCAMQVVWGGCDDRGTRLGSGVYFIELRTGEYSETRKVLLIR